MPRLEGARLRGAVLVFSFLSGLVLTLEFFYLKTSNDLTMVDYGRAFLLTSLLSLCSLAVVSVFVLPLGYLFIKNISKLYFVSLVAASGGMASFIFFQYSGHAGASAQFFLALVGAVFFLYSVLKDKDVALFSVTKLLLWFFYCAGIVGVASCLAVIFGLALGLGQVGKTLGSF